MVKVIKEGLISEVQSRPALWREDHANFRRRDLTDKLWEEVAVSCNILNDIIILQIRINRICEYCPSANYTLACSPVWPPSRSLARLSVWPNP
uniref:MADF domain-containing protein n=1 Tax=Timema poppense TaxID=170557 RepID=A0A7R9HHK5_TIMPO|nr:unnamed protein product [Timema poppensis]